MNAKPRNNIRKPLLFGGGFLFLVFALFSYMALTFKKNVSSNSFLLEGWVNTNILTQFVSDHIKNTETHFFITGVKYPNSKDLSVRKNNNGIHFINKNIWFYSNGMVEINCSDSKVKKLDVVLKGYHSKNTYPFYSIAINNHLLKAGFVNDTSLSFNIDSLNLLCANFTVSFFNDDKNKTEDRNLQIESIYINDSLVTLKSENLTFYKDFTVDCGFLNRAEFVKNYLIALGIDPEKITTIPFSKPDYNFTLKSAHTASNYFINNNIKVNSLNILTEHWHAFRSYTTYTILMKNSYEIGVLYYKDEEDPYYSNPVYLPKIMLGELISVLGTVLQLKL